MLVASFVLQFGITNKLLLVDGYPAHLPKAFKEDSARR